METVVLKSNSSESLNLLIKLAEKLGIEVSILSKESTEDIALANAIKTGRTGQNIDTANFLKQIRK